MKLTNLHFHLVDVHELKFWEFQPEISHVVYKNTKNERKFSFPRQEPGDIVDDELVCWGCAHLEVETPIEAEESVRKKLDENTNEGTE